MVRITIPPGLEKGPKLLTCERWESNNKDSFISSFPNLKKRQ